MTTSKQIKISQIKSPPLFHGGQFIVILRIMCMDIQNNEFAIWCYAPLKKHAQLKAFLKVSARADRRTFIRKRLSARNPHKGKGYALSINALDLNNFSLTSGQKKK